MVIRTKTKYRGGDIIDVMEYPDGRYGGKGVPRLKKKKATPEAIQEVNKRNKERRCRAYLLEYFRKDDIFITWTYRPGSRPSDMAEALKDFQKAARFLRTEYRKRDRELFWIRNIEQGTRGAWHIHIVVNHIPGCEELLRKAWKKGGIYMEQIRDSEKFGDEDMTRLACYLTKDENPGVRKEDGSREKPRLKGASYGHSRNMQLPPRRKQRLRRWKKEIKPKKGYYITHMWEGINPYTGHKCRRYTMIRERRLYESNRIYDDHINKSGCKRRSIRGGGGVCNPVRP